MYDAKTYVEDPAVVAKRVAAKLAAERAGDGDDHAPSRPAKPVRKAGAASVHSDL